MVLCFLTVQLMRMGAIENDNNGLINYHFPCDKH